MPAGDPGAPRPPGGALERLGPVGVGLACGALFALMAPSVPGPKDAPEFTLVLAFNGVAHPTGYPLYVLLGHPFVLALHALGVGWARAANLWSTAGGAVAMGLLHALTLRAIPRSAPLGSGARFLLALVPPLALSVNPIWLLDAIFAEIYTWHLAWVCAAALGTLGLLRASAAPSRGRTRTDRGPGARDAAIWGLLMGIGLAHHRTAVLPAAVFSASLVLGLVRARAFRGSFLVVAVVAALVPLLSYGFIAWRAFHPAAWQWPPLDSTWPAIRDHVMGAGYADLLGRFAPDAVQRELLSAHLYPLLFPALALLGAVIPLLRTGERWGAATLLAAGLAQTLYTFQYGVRDPSSYFAPALALALVSVPLAVAVLPGRFPAMRTKPAAAAAVLVIAAGLALLAARGFPVGDSIRRGAIETDRRMRATWEKIPPGPGFVLWDHDMATVFQVYQRLEGRRPELDAGNPAMLSWPRPRREFRERNGFDPLAGLDPLTSEKALQIPANIRRQTPLPVSIFDLYGQQVNVLPGPVAPATPDSVPR